MGGRWSSLESEPSHDPWWPNQQSHSATDHFVADDEEATDESGTSKQGKVRKEELEVFKEELARKRALRQEAIATVQAELRELRGKAEDERKLREKVEAERDKLRAQLARKEVQGNPVEEGVKREMKTELESGPAKKLSEREEELLMELEKEREEKNNLLVERDLMQAEMEEKAGLQRQVQALKDVSEIGKEMLRIRELQVKELKRKLVEVNLSSVMAPPEDLRIEYEKQIENIRKLRTLYEERAAATSLEHRRELEREEAKVTVLETKLQELQKEADEVKEAKKELEDKIEKLENLVQSKENELETTKGNLFSSTVQNKSLNSQITLINNLFSQMLVSPKVDLDRLTRLLKENHGLITDLTSKGDSNEVAALLIDLAGQIEKEQTSDKNENAIEEVDSNISSNLTKVWKVLIELLSHHENPTHTELAGGAESCYKCVQTPSGPRSVISVSQTFLTLKDLILEKNKLVKEVGRLKTLNNHLENRLGNQEKRLSVVTLELRKTWGVVNKLKAQHKQLHTHEKILRYELHQKRCMLTELKQELEHCKDKWDLAREKNSQTEEDWKKLRKEFALRKTRKESNSAESGYEEDDVAQSPPSEPVNQEDLFVLRPVATSEPELSEDDIEHSDGNSFDTVIDLLDIAYLENSQSQSTVPFVLCEVPPEGSEISPSLLPLTGSEFTEGLDQIESEDLAAVLDVQYQNQLLGADYNLSLPSSSGSSPIPTENDDFASSEMDISEEDSSSNSNNIFSSPSLPTVTQTSSNDSLLFGSNSSQNISRFLDGLFVDNQQTESRISSPHNLALSLPCSSQSASENDSATPLVGDNNCYLFPSKIATSVLSKPNGNLLQPNNSTTLVEEFGNIQTEQTAERSKEAEGMDHVQKWVIDAQISSLDRSSTTEQSFREKSVDVSSETRSQEEILRARENRMKKLEYQCRSLVNKVTSTSFRSDIISNKLDELHLSYGPGDNESDNSEKHTIPALTHPSEEIDHTGFKQSAIGLSATGVEAVNLNLPIHCQKPYLNEESQAGCSSYSEPSPPSSSPVQRKTPEEILEARAARLKRLEDQCKSLFSKMSATSSRSELISNKLDELHESYGATEQTVKDQSKLKKSPLLEKSSSFEKQNTNNVLTNLPKLETCHVTAHENEIPNDNAVPGPSTVKSIQTADLRKGRSPEEMLDARAERFKRLEDQCKSLVSQMTATSKRSEIISNKLDKLHSSYGSSEDTSDGEENPFLPKDGKKRSTPTSSPRNSRKLALLAEKQIELENNTAKNNLDKTEYELPNENTNVSSSSSTKNMQAVIKISNALEASTSPKANRDELNKCFKQKSEQCQVCQPLAVEPSTPSISVTSKETEQINSGIVTDPQTTNNKPQSSENSENSVDQIKNI